MSGGGGSQVTGYKYFFGIHAGIGRGEMDELVEIRVGTKLAAQPRMTASGTGDINVPNLFGGDKKEGGIKGSFKLLMGEPTQTMPGDLAAMIAPAAPTGFRRMVTLFYEGLVASLNPYPKPWSFRMRRALKGWDGAPLRPDLAVIDLLGPETGAGSESDPYGSEMQASIGADVPAAIYVTAHVVPDSGRRITAIRSATYSAPDEMGTFQVPYGEIEYQTDGSAIVRLTQEWFPKNITWYYTYEPLGGGAPRNASVMATASGVPRPILARVVPIPGTTITQVLSMFQSYTSDGGTIYRPIYMQATTPQPDGTVLVSLPPEYWQMHSVFATYSSPSGNKDVSVTQFTNPNPVSFTVEAPSGGLLTQVLAVQRLVDPGWGSGEDSKPATFENIDFTLAGNVVTTYDPRVSGANVQVIIKYRPRLNQDATFIPIREIKAMNPAHIVYEALTNREWGRGLDRSLLNTASFEQCAVQLFNEKFGMCIRWARRDSIDSFIQEILDTCAATLYMDSATALMTMRLIRKDYVVEDLKLWDVNNGILTITGNNVNTSSVVINEVIVKYREVVFNEERSVNVQNLASLQSGSFKTMTKTYKGIPTSDLARRVAQRDLRANAEGLRRYTITMDRRGSHITPGHVMRIQDVSRKIPPTVVRVATAKSEGPNSGRITLLVIQDVFAFPARSFTADQPNTWTPPNFQPCIGEHEVFEVPYFLLARTMSRADFEFVDNNSAYLGVVAEQAKLTNVGYDLAVRSGAPTSDDVPTTNAAMYCGYEP